MKLNSVVRRTTAGRHWCGPAALSAITGISYDRIRRELADLMGKRSVTGTPIWAALLLLRKHGIKAYNESWVIKADQKERGNRPTLARWLRIRPDRKALYLVHLTGHLVVVKGNKFVDNHTMTPVWLKDSPHRRKRVMCAWRIER